MQRSSRHLWLLGALSLAACQSPPPTEIQVPVARPHGLSALPEGASPQQRAAAAGGFAAALDARGAPQLITATSRQPAPAGVSAEQAARFHLRRFGVLDQAPVSHVQDLGAAGHIVHLRQQVGDIEIYGGDLKVRLRADQTLSSITGAPQPGRVLQRGRFRLGPEQALAAALGHLYQTSVDAAAVADVGPAPGAGLGRYRLYHLSDRAGAIRLTEPAHIKRVYYPAGDHVVPAYFVEFFSAAADRADAEAFRYLIAAADGAVLERADLTAYDAFKYRVWAQTDGDQRPLDGPQADFTPHPTGVPDGSQPAFIAPNLVSVEGRNHNLFGQSDPWLASGATQTRGNNVDAYADQFAPDGYSNGDIRATTTATATFDRTYDVLAEAVAAPTQTMAAITQLFYTINWLHDDWYDNGFNEAAGNAQLDNFGRGGVAGDLIKAEAQDSYATGARNNANMSTPADGFSPRMQVYVWSGSDSHKLTLSSTATAPESGVAGFGPKNFTLTGTVVLADDGTAPTSDACQALVAPATGKIVLVDRGSCSFKTKVVSAQNAGAVGVLVANNAAGLPPTLGDDGTIPTPVTIPIMSLSQADGASLKTALTAGPVTATLTRKAGPERDGGLDNQVVAHEWGHYLHHRLSNCGGTQQCGALSEGWADFVAMHMTLRPGDNLDGVFANAIYDAISFGDSGYFGIRRFPYSVDRTKNALSLRHIGNGVALPAVPTGGGGANSEVHNAGEVWASMLFEAYVALQKQTQGPKRTFDDIRRLMARYAVEGLQLTPVNATYTEARDGVLAAVAAHDLNDLKIVAEAFARRGAGTCAVAPPRDSTTLVGVTESSVVQPRVALGAIRLDDSAFSCDKDGVLDQGERGRLTVEVSNAGPVALTDAVLRLSAPGGEVNLLGSVNLPKVDPYSTVPITVEVTPAKPLTMGAPVQIAVEVSSPSSCEGKVSRAVSFRVNFDEVPASSATDDFESARLAWAKAGDGASDVWSRAADGATNHVALGIDSGSLTDTQLVSPELKVSPTEAFVIRFEHRYSFEVDSSTMPPTYYDAAVIELTEDGGKTWKDIKDYIDPGYGGIVTDTSGNPLAKRSAFVAQSAGWPARKELVLDLGQRLAGKAVKIRFRIGTDQATGDFGWELDNLRLSGITNLPFGSLKEDPGHCRGAAVQPGADQTVQSGATVILNASGSSDADGRPLSFQWAQIAGPAVTLVSTSSAITGFTAPMVTTATTLTFQVEVNNGLMPLTGAVNVTVTPPATMDKGGCSASRGRPAPLSLGLLLLPVVLLLRRRLT